MNSNGQRLKSEKFKMSWSNIASAIETQLRAFGKIPDNVDVLSLKMDYPGGYVSQEKVIEVEIVKKKGVEILKFG